jgi:hypothetical protein
MIDHTAGDPVVTTVDPTVDADGSVTTVVSCVNCGTELSKNVETLDKLESVNVTVEATDLGVTTLNDADATDGVTTKVAKNSTVTLTATPVDGAEFVGWSVNGKIVSENATYKAVALANITYVPVFTETTSDTFTVVFVDSYGNVISTQTVASADEIVEPTAPARVGYTFSSWNQDISALTEGATVVAQYTKDATATYTVTATGCDITVNGETVTDSATDLAYDTKVTVTATGATEWYANGSTDPVGYGESYTFYVGSNITLTYGTAGVNATPTVTAVNVSAVSGSDYKVAFLATRTIPDGYKLVSAGFVYGKNVDADNLTLENVGSGVYAVYASTSSEQFQLTTGVKSKTGTLRAKAFIVYTDGSTQTTAYADAQEYAY